MYPKDMIELLAKQWEIIKQAPLPFIPAFLICAIIIHVADHYFFKSFIEGKDDLIATKTQQISELREQSAELNNLLDKQKAQLAESQQAVLEAKTAIQKPEFRLEMSGGYVFIPDMPDKENIRTGLAINAKIWNTGKASIVTEWSLVVTPAGGPPGIGQLTAIPNQLVARGPINSNILKSTDELDFKTKNDAVGDVPVDGVLLFFVPLDQQKVLANSTILELSAKDIYQTETTSRKLMGDWWRR